MRCIGILFAFAALASHALEYDVSTRGVAFKLGNETVLSSPAQGLWTVAQDWSADGKPCEFTRVFPSRIDAGDGWTAAYGEAKTRGGVWRFKDVYSKRGNMVKCVRRYEYSGKDAEKVSLQNEFVVPVKSDRLLVPGVLYYGNPSGYRNGGKKIGKGFVLSADAAPGVERVPTFSEKDSPDVLFEEHRLPMPFACIEFSKGAKIYSAALHTVPSKAAYGNVPDQWWSLGAQLRADCTALVSSSGAVAYNGKWGRIKSLQTTGHAYPGSYLNVKDGAVIQKIFYISAAECREGSGFMQAVDASIDIFEPYGAEGMPAFGDIVKTKYEFSRARYAEGKNYAGFLMHSADNMKRRAKLKQSREDIVMGWCGQAAAPGYAYQHLYGFGDAEKMRSMVQKSMDFLSTSPFGDRGFKVRYAADSNEWYSDDYVSQGQALENVLMAVDSAKKAAAAGAAPFDTSRWEAFAKRACAFHSDRILDGGWRSVSTNEAFFAAPLALGYKIFGGEKFKAAALKIADVFAERHLGMREVYWGGTLDAVGEDKEGAWAAFQAFLAAYDVTGLKKYLDYAKHAAYAALTYTVVWRIDMPAGRLCDNGFNSTGWTAVSPQNEHLDVYGVLLSPQIYRMGKLLKDERLEKLGRVMFLSCGQLLDENGAQGEQIHHTNYAQHDTSLQSDWRTFRGGYVEGWTPFWITAHFLNAAAQFRELGAPFAK